jgi:hypothetical protein
MITPLDAIVARNLVIPALNLADSRSALIATIAEAESKLARNPSIELAMQIDRAKEMISRGDAEMAAKYSELNSHQN